MTTRPEREAPALDQLKALWRVANGTERLLFLTWLAAGESLFPPPGESQSTQVEAARHPEHGPSPSSGWTPCTSCGHPEGAHPSGQACLTCSCNQFLPPDPQPIGDKALRKASAVSSSLPKAQPGSSAGSSPSRAK